MPPTKIQVEAKAPAQPAAVIEAAKQPALADKQRSLVGTAGLQRAAAGSLPPPGGSGAPNGRTADSLVSGSGGATQARLMRAMQGTLGNARIARMMCNSSATAAPATVQRKCACGGEAGAGGECAACRAKREASVQRQVVGPEGSDHVPPSVERALASSQGQALPRDTQTRMERAFGTSLGDVRVHTGAQSAEANRDISAAAFTAGSDIHFAPGRYNPSSADGQHLLAHELTHVVQQRAGRVPVGSPRIGPAGDAFEREADQTAHAVQRSLSVAPTRSKDEEETGKPGGGIMRTFATGPPGAIMRAVAPRRCARSKSEGETGTTESTVMRAMTTGPPGAFMRAPVQCQCARGKSEGEAGTGAVVVMRAMMTGAPSAGTSQRSYSPVGQIRTDAACAACRVQRQAAAPVEGAPEPPDPAAAFALKQRLRMPGSSCAPIGRALATERTGMRLHGGSVAMQAARNGDLTAFSAHQADTGFGAGRARPSAAPRALPHPIQKRDRQAAPMSAMRPGALMPVGPGGIQRSILGDIEDVASDVGGAIVSGAEAAGHAVVSGAEAAGHAVVSGAEAAGHAVVSGAEAVGHAVVSGAEAVGHAVESAADWLATEAGQIAQRIAAALGVNVRITSSGLEIVVARSCPIHALPFSFSLGSLSQSLMAPLVRIPIGPGATITGSVGLTGTLAPAVQLQVGPVCLDGLRVLINPITGSFSVSGSVSATAAGSLSAEARGGLRGEVRLDLIIPVGDIPVPVSVPVIGLEGGLAGMLRGIGATTLRFGGGFSFGGGVITMNQSRQFDLGLGADFFLGAYAQLDLLGMNVCRIYWQPFQWHGGIGVSLGVNAGLSIGGSVLPSFTVAPPTLERIPFDRFPLAISRAGFRDDCPIKDKLCAVLRDLKLLPSQNGGSWSWTGPYGPGKRLPGPLRVYEKNPGIASGHECRGACGPNCDTCKHSPVYRYTDPTTGDVWEYANYQDCNSHAACREHDAAFDWAADKKGEVGKGHIIMPWHMAANIECTCNHPVGNCIAWIRGLPPHDMKMLFADSATKVPTPGPGPTPGPTPVPTPFGPTNAGCYPTKRYPGNREHEVIEQDYLKNINPSSGAAEYLIPESGPNGGTGYADIVDVRRRIVYEIKTFVGAPKGVDEAERYAEKATEHCTPPKKWRVGNDYPEHEIPFTATQELVVKQYPKFPGVVVYYQRKKEKKKKGSGP